MSDKKWPDHFPEGCPPEEAENKSVTVFRFFDKSKARPQDFRSYRERKPNDDFKYECLACGLSVYTCLEDLKIKQQRIPGMNRKTILSIELQPESGVFLSTPTNRDSHCTWWIPSDADPLKYCK